MKKQFITTILISSILFNGCADKDKETAKESAAKFDSIEFLLNKKYEHIITGKERSAGSEISFDEKNKFHINSYYQYGKNEDGSVNVCDIEGDLTKISNDVLLLIKTEDINSDSAPESTKIQVLLSLEMMNDGTIKIKLINPKTLSLTFCGQDSDMAIDGIYKISK